MKFDVKRKNTWSDKGGAYFSVPSGIYETEDKTEIELLKGCKDAKVIKETKTKPVD